MSSTPDPKTLFPLPPLPDESTLYRTVLLDLFQHPYLALQKARSRRSWLAPVLVLLSMSFLAAVLKVLLVFPGIVSETRAITSHVAENLEAIWFENGQLQWQAGWELPHTLRANQWRFDFAQQSESFPAERELATSVEQRGLLVEPKTVTLWLRQEGDDRRVLKVPLLNEKKLDGIGQHAMEMVGNGKERLNEADLVRYAQAVCVAMTPFMLLYYTLAQIKPIFLSVFIFIFMAFVFRREWRGSTVELWVVAVHCCIPPFLLALVYSFLRLTQVTYQEIFLLAFLLFLILLYFDTKAYLRAADPEGQDG